MIVGYARTSTSEQKAGLDAQVKALIWAQAEKIFNEQVSSVGERDQLELALDYVREGDIFAVTKIDRLARSTADLLRIVDRLNDKGAFLRVLDFGGASLDTGSPNGKLMLTMFAAMAQFEREIMLERQRDGIAKAKADGKYKGRKPTVLNQADKIKALKAEGMGATKIANQLGVARASVYRALAA